MIRVIILSVLLPWITPAAGEEAVKGGGHVITQTREFEVFDAIELRIPADMHIAIGKPTPLTIETDDNIIPLIKMEVHKGRLVISSDREFTTNNGPDINMTVAKLQAVEVVGAGDMWVTKVDNARLSVAATGAADVHLSGKTKELSLAATGASDVFAYDLDVQVATATLTGEADAKLTVFKSLNVTITGPGDLHYKGNPTVSKTIVGNGDVKQVNAFGGA